MFTGIYTQLIQLTHLLPTPTPTGKSFAVLCLKGCKKYECAHSFLKLLDIGRSTIRGSCKLWRIAIIRFIVRVIPQIAPNIHDGVSTTFHPIEPIESKLLADRNCCVRRTFM